MNPIWYGLAVSISFLCGFIARYYVDRFAEKRLRDEKEEIISLEE